MAASPQNFQHVIEENRNLHQRVRNLSETNRRLALELEELKKNFSRPGKAQGGFWD